MSEKSTKVKLVVNPKISPEEALHTAVQQIADQSSIVLALGLICAHIEIQKELKPKQNPVLNLLRREKKIFEQKIPEEERKILKDWQNRLRRESNKSGA